MAEKVEKKEVNIGAPDEKVLEQASHKHQTGLQTEDGRIVHPATGKELKQNLKNIWAPK